VLHKVLGAIAEYLTLVDC